MTPRSPAPLLAAGLLAAAAVATGAPAAQAAGERGPQGASVLSVEPNDTAIDGWGGWLVWSRRADDGTFGLVARTPEGVGVLLPVPAQTAPIDASIGPGPDGGPLVVYARCTRPDASPPIGCDVHRIDPRTGVDAPVPSASLPGVDERAPAVWGNRIAFSRSVGRPRAGRSAVALTTLDATEPPSRLIYPPAKERIGTGKRNFRAYTPDSIDLQGSTLAFVWHATGLRDRWRLVVQRGQRRGKILLTATSTRSTLRRLGRPVLSAGEVTVPRLRTGMRSRSEIYRTTLSGRKAWTLESGFSGAQTTRYGSALTAVAAPTPTAMVLVRRLASDGRWSCKNAAVAEARGCEVLQVDRAAQPWRKIRPQSEYP
ncbi:hypothetical protein [Patulibacter americanus]|uniref:hypothetical protein n=1 Tax=Patulibacter americanus TaxID=588672 RepID=UPI0003B4143B|nr:hypothetical protein [Patulibacter americanus]